MEVSKNPKFKSIYIETTKNCNLNCPFCPSVSIRTKNLEISSFQEIIDKTKDFTDGYYLHLLGEPLTNVLLSKYFEIIEKAHKTVRITTNGTLLKERTTELLSTNCLDRINVSLQAWHFIDQEKVEVYLNNLKDFILKKRILKPKLSICLRFWNDKNNPETLKMNEYLLTRLEDLLGMSLRSKRPEPYLLISKEDEFLWPELNHPDNLCFSPCLGGKKQLGILLNGDVVLCCLDYKGHTKIGNIYESSLKEILEGELYKKHNLCLQKRTYYFPLCKKCTFRDRFK